MNAALGAQRTRAALALPVLARFDSPAARVLMVAIGLQESRFIHREQVGGPARGFWQFELGGVRGVLNHPVSQDLARALCRARGAPPTPSGVYTRLAADDLLAAGFARLLLLTDPRPLPPPDNLPAGWDYYLRNWRPGKPHPGSWPACHAAAVAALETP